MIDVSLKWTGFGLQRTDVTKKQKDAALKSADFSLKRNKMAPRKGPMWP